MRLRALLITAAVCAGSLGSTSAMAWSFSWGKYTGWPTRTTSNNTPSTGTPAPSPVPAPSTGGGTSTADGCTLSAEDKAMLDAVNAARAQGRSCGGSYYQAAPALTWSCGLSKVALGHSTDMATHNFFSHTGSDGLTVGQRVSNAGYRWSAVGENIAAGYADVTKVMDGWLKSAGHCANIMNRNYTQLGAASYRSSGSSYGIYWTQVFARPR